MNWGAVLGAGLKGVSATVDSRDNRTRELLIESERQRKAQREDSVLNSRIKREEQDAADDATDRANKESERIKKEIADAAETKRRETELPLRVRIARDLVPEFKDETKYDAPTLQSYLANDDNWKGVMSRVGKPAEGPARGSSAALQIIADETTARERAQAPFQRSQGGGSEAVTLPDGTVVSGKAPKTTEGERKAAGFLHRVNFANTNLSKFDSQSVLEEIKSKTGMLGNWSKTPQGQLLRQAGRMWATSVLRPESGATIRDDELNEYFDTYLPRPGDDPKTLEQKRASRRVAEEAIAVQAGSAKPLLDQFKGVAPTQPPDSKKRKRTAAEILRDAGINDD